MHALNVPFWHPTYHNCIRAHVYIYPEQVRLFTLFRQGKRHPYAHTCALLINITSLVGGYSTLDTQPYLCKVCYPTKYSYVLVRREGPAVGRRRTEKLRSTAKKGSKLTSVLTAAKPLAIVNTQSPSRPSYSVTRKKARGGANNHFS